MSLLKILMILCVLIISILFSLGNILSMKKMTESEKPSPFECGFNTKQSKWMPFSMAFFLSATIFLIFDVELVLIFPFLMNFMWQYNMFSSLTVVVFLFILSLGFFLEWSQKFLEWKS